MIDARRARLAAPDEKRQSPSLLGGRRGNQSEIEQHREIDRLELKAAGEQKGGEQFDSCAPLAGPPPPPPVRAQKAAKKSIKTLESAVTQSHGRNQKKRPR